MDIVEANASSVRFARTRAEGGRFDGIVDLTRLTNGHVMCCICFSYTPKDQLWFDELEQLWDVCQPCAVNEKMSSPGAPGGDA